MNIKFFIKNNLANTKIKPTLGKLFFLKENNACIKIDDGVVMDIDTTKKLYIIWQKDEGLTDGQCEFEIDFDGIKFDKKTITILNAPSAEGVDIIIE